MKNVSVSVAMIALLTGCECTAHRDEPPAPPTIATQAVGETSDWSIPIDQLEHANVAADVNVAVGNGDFRPMGVMGIVLMVPGIDRTTFESMTGGVRIIPRTGDSMQNAEQMRFQDIAYDYAEKYNRILLTRLPHPTLSPAHR